MSILTIITGLFASYLFLCIFFKKVAVEKFIVFFFAAFFLLSIATGYFYKQFDISLTSFTFLIAYGIFAVLFWLLKKDFCYFTLGRRDILTIAIFLGSIIFYFYPSLPHLSPSCIAGDCTTHMQLMAYIYDKHSFMKEFDYSFAALTVYPFGIHLIVGILGILLNIHPLILVSIVLSIISALCLLAAYGITKELAGNKLIPIITGILVLLSIYPVSALTDFGFYPQILGNFLILVFLWIAKDYMESKRFKYLLFLGLLFFGITHSFPFYIPIAGATMLLVLIFDRDAPIKIRFKHALFFFFLACLIFWRYFFVEVQAGSGQNPGSSRLWDLHSFFEKVRNALNMDGNVTFRDTTIMVFTLPVLSLLSLFTGLRIKERRSLFLFLVPIILQILAFYFAYFYLNAGAYWYLKNFYLLIYPMAILSTLFLDDLFAKFWKFRYSSIPPLLLSHLVTLSLIFPSALDSRSAFGSNIWVTPMKELLRYNRAGNVPELILISDWMKKSLPEHARVYYTGTYNTCWLYAISRNRIMIEEKVNLDSIPEGLLLYRTRNGAIYKEPFTEGSKIGSCYKLELDSIFPEREILPPPQGVLSSITDKQGDALNARGENVPELDIISADVTQPVKGQWKFELKTSGKIPVSPRDLPAGNYIQYQFGVDADQNPLLPRGGSVSVSGAEYVIDVFIDPLYTPAIRASLCVITPFSCTSLPIVTVARNRLTVQVPQDAMKNDLLFDWSVYGAVAGGERSASDAYNKRATVNLNLTEVRR